VIDQEGPIHVSNVMLLDPQVRRADPCRDQARGRPPRSGRQEDRNGDRVMAVATQPSLCRGSRSATGRRSAPT